jgi:hypothetical protein
MKTQSANRMRCTLTPIGSRAGLAIVLAGLSLGACSSPSEPALMSVAGPSAVQAVAAAVTTPSLPGWIANPTVIPSDLEGRNNCTFPFGPGATGGIWDYHADGACWERPGPDGWTRQQQHLVHVPQHASCGGGPADVSPIRICREGGADQPTPCDVNPTTGPLGCAICVRSVICH